MKRMLTSCFGLGFIPVASGTWGSLPTVFIFAGMCLLYSGWGLIAANAVLMIVLAIFASVVCIKYTPHVMKITDRKDPGEIVADEFAGQAVTFLGAYASGYKEIAVVAMMGFLLFRFLDILKPWPIRRMEKFPKGWGVLLDDILAGFFACILLNISIWAFHKGHLGVVQGQITVFSAMILGSVQGLTEFLPVSSSGHLVLFEHFLELNPDTPQMLVFDLITHVGTVLAILVIFRGSIIAFIKNLLASAKYGQTPVEIYKKSPGVHFLVLAVISTVVTFAIYEMFEHIFISARGNLALVAVMWAITATVLLITDYRKKTRKSLRETGILAAVIIGMAQAAAIMPGISRSGSTICCAILLGLHRRWAIEYSFLLAMPAILGGTIITLFKNWDKLVGTGLTGGVLLAGALSACVIGIVALKLLIGATRSKNFKIFAIYCYLLSIGVGIYLIIAR